MVIIQNSKHYHPIVVSVTDIDKAILIHCDPLWMAQLAGIAAIAAKTPQVLPGSGEELNPMVQAVSNVEDIGCSIHTYTHRQTQPALPPPSLSKLPKILSLSGEHLYPSIVAVSYVHTALSVKGESAGTQKLSTPAPTVSETAVV